MDCLRYCTHSGICGGRDRQPVSPTSHQTPIYRTLLWYLIFIMSLQQTATQLHFTTIMSCNVTSLQKVKKVKHIELVAAGKAKENASHFNCAMLESMTMHTDMSYYNLHIFISVRTYFTYHPLIPYSSRPSQLTASFWCKSFRYIEVSWKKKG